ncbi:class I SAM-dependent methyltransferase [Ligaoa zhengdingensis]|uniref:class I SAM-dependent methyltransferase n=1 Tax=Ligaoa zhengdingensis TaxID=2763658 RepID=UPI0031BB3D43
MKKTFWDRTAKVYDRFMRKDHRAYKKMYVEIYPVVRHKNVLELATGTGLIAKHIVRSADRIEATDASPKMIEQARLGNDSAKLHFSVQDMFSLPYAPQSFDVVIVSNALHVVPHPEKALAEIRRVLKNDGVLIAPTFTHDGDSWRGKIKVFLMKLAGFPLVSKWFSEEYIAFLQSSGWTVRKSMVLKASFPLTYAECVKKTEEAS